MTDIICSRPECQTTAGCQCRKPFAVNFTWGHVKDLQTKEIAALKAEIERLRNALIWYAERSHWDGDLFLEGDYGTLARRALAQQEGDST